MRLGFATVLTSAHSDFIMPEAQSIPILPRDTMIKRQARRIARSPIFRTINLMREKIQRRYYGILITTLYINMVKITSLF